MAQDMIKIDGLQLQDVRQAIAQRQEAMAKLRDQIAETDLGRALADLEEQVAVLRREEKQHDASLRVAMENEYRKEGTKRFPVGQVKEMTRIDYNEQVAVEYALSRKEFGLVKLDKAKFDRMARALNEAGVPLEFVEVSKYPKAYVAKEFDLTS